MPIEAVVFDKDGTLFDFEASWADAMVVLLEKMAEGSDRLRLAYGLGFDLDARKFQPDSIAIAGTIQDIVGVIQDVLPKPADEVRSQVEQISAEAVMAPVTDLVTCMQAVGNGRVLGVVTNDGEAVAKRHLRDAGILDMFAFVAGFDSGFGQKPGPGPLIAFCKINRLGPRKLLDGWRQSDRSQGRESGWNGDIGRADRDCRGSGTGAFRRRDPSRYRPSSQLVGRRKPILAPKTTILVGNVPSFGLRWSNMGPRRNHGQRHKTSPRRRAGREPGSPLGRAV